MPFDKNKYVKNEIHNIYFIFLPKFFGAIISVILLFQSIFNIFGVNEAEFTSTNRIMFTAAAFMAFFIFDKVSEFMIAKRDAMRTGENIESIIKQNQEQANHVFTRIEELNESISKTFNVERIESLAKVDEQLSRKLDDASSVRNTFIGISGGKSKSKIVGLYDSFLSKNDNSWHDVVTISELFSERFAMIQPNHTSSARHTITVLRHSMPMVNFIILDYPDHRKSEAYWGWVEAEKNSGGASLNVFRSNEIEIVTMFENLFSGLIRHKSQSTIQTDFTKTGEARFSAKMTHRVVNREGRWYTHAYRKWKDPNLRTQVSHACFSIIYVESKPIIDGLIFEHKTKKIVPIEHKDQIRIDSSDERIFLEFSARKNGERRDGFVLYKFGHFKEFDIVSGFFMNPFDRQFYEIFGIKLDSDSLKKVTQKTLKEISDENAQSLEDLYQEYFNPNC